MDIDNKTTICLTATATLSGDELAQAVADFIGKQMAKAAKAPGGTKLPPGFAIKADDVTFPKRSHYRQGVTVTVDVEQPAAEPGGE